MALMCRVNCSWKRNLLIHKAHESQLNCPVKWVKGLSQNLISHYFRFVFISIHSKIYYTKFLQLEQAPIAGKFIIGVSQFRLLSNIDIFCRKHGEFAFLVQG